MRTVSFYIASSLDGYIAKPNDDLGFVKLVEKEGEDCGYARFTSTVDTIILGRKTYDWVVTEKEINEKEGQEKVEVFTLPHSALGLTTYYIISKA